MSRLESVSERIVRIRENLQVTGEQPRQQPSMGTTFSKESGPLFDKAFNQIFNQWQQDSGKKK